MKTTRPSFKAFKAKALENPEVKAEYKALKPIFEIKQQDNITKISKSPRI